MAKFGGGMPREHTSTTNAPSFPEKTPKAVPTMPVGAPEMGAVPSTPAIPKPKTAPGLSKSPKPSSMAGQSARAGGKRLNNTVLEKNGM